MRFEESSNYYLLLHKRLYKLYVIHLITDH
jgi:hypothetical protein